MRKCTNRAAGGATWALTALGAALAGGCVDRRESEVMDAVRAAYLLERRVLDDRESITSREQVVGIYRLGFGDSLAERLADLSWSPRERRVRPAGFALEPPARVVPRAVHRSDATVVFETPTAQRILWLQGAFTVAELRREGGAWRIVRASSVADTPPELVERR